MPIGGRVCNYILALYSQYRVVGILFPQHSMCKAGTSLVCVSEAAASPCSLVLPLIRGDGRALHDPLPHHLAVEAMRTMGVVRPGRFTGWDAGTLLQGVVAALLLVPRCPLILI